MDIFFLGDGTWVGDSVERESWRAFEGMGHEDHTAQGQVSGL